MLKDIPFVLARLKWMREEQIWPNGLRYLWTDAFGVVLLVSLYKELGDQNYLAEAEWVVSEVDRVLGRSRGIRIGQEADRDGQYFHYLAQWVFALTCLGNLKPGFRQRAIDPHDHAARGAGPRVILGEIFALEVVELLRELLEVPLEILHGLPATGLEGIELVQALAPRPYRTPLG